MTDQYQKKATGCYLQNDHVAVDIKHSSGYNSQSIQSALEYIILDRVHLDLINLRYLGKVDVCDVARIDGLTRVSDQCWVEGVGKGCKDGVIYASFGADFADNQRYRY